MGRTGSSGSDGDGADRGRTASGGPGSADAETGGRGRGGADIGRTDAGGPGRASTGRAGADRRDRAGAAADRGRADAGGPGNAVPGQAGAAAARGSGRVGSGSVAPGSDRCGTASGRADAGDPEPGRADLDGSGADAAGSGGRRAGGTGAGGGDLAPRAPGRVCVGALAGAFGVQGEVRLKSFCVPPEAIAGYGPLWTEDGTRAFRLRLTRPVAGALGARLDGVATREAAEALRGQRLFADRAALPALPEDEFYHADLIGLAAHDPGGALVGHVRAVLNHGAGDLLELARPSGPSVLVPFSRAVVPTVDLARGRLVIDPPEGLLE